MQISNHKPVELSPIYIPKISNSFSPEDYIKASMVEPLYTPFNTAMPCVMTDKNNQPITEDTIVKTIIDCCDVSLNIPAETVMKDIFSKTLVDFDSTTLLPIQNTFSIQSATKTKLPFPSNTMIYTPAQDIIPSCKHFLAGTGGYDELFASFAFYARPNTLGFYFTTENEFNDFKAFVATQVGNMSSVLPAATNQLFIEFQTLTLDKLTESLRLRANDSDNNEPYSFARAIIYFLMVYIQQNTNGLVGVFPFEVGELFCPKSVVFVNIEKHSQATQNQIANEWKIINDSLKLPYTVMSNKKLAKLTAQARSLAKASAQAAYQSAKQQDYGRSGTAKSYKFRKSQPAPIDIVKILKRVINKMTFVTKSENIYKAVKISYNKPNRRDPDDYNKPGKIVSTKYRPDIHVYLDTSGSISESNYQEAIQCLIRIAKALDVNLYINSFSHYMSSATLVQVKGKSAKQAYKAFMKIPKVSGGTDYEQIWNYINESKKRRRELSIIITDFEWAAPNRYVKHPKNLYYIPCSNMDWNTIVSSAKYFCKSMQTIDPNCRKKLLF